MYCINLAKYQDVIALLFPNKGRKNIKVQR